MNIVAKELLAIARTILAARWNGPIPKTCQICGNQMKEMGKTFYDAKLINHRKAIVCEECFDDFGIGLDTEYGQQYDLETGHLLAGDQPPPKPIRNPAVLDKRTLRMLQFQPQSVRREWGLE